MLCLVTNFCLANCVPLGCRSPEAFGVALQAKRKLGKGNHGSWMRDLHRYGNQGRPHRVRRFRSALICFGTHIHCACVLYVGVSNVSVRICGEVIFVRVPREAKGMLSIHETIRDTNSRKK